MNHKTTRRELYRYILGVMTLLNFSIHAYAQPDRLRDALNDQPYSVIQELIDQGAVVQNEHLEVVLQGNNRDKYPIAELLIKKGADINSGGVLGTVINKLNDMEFLEFLADKGFRYSEAVDPQTGKSLLYAAIEFYMSYDGIEGDQTLNTLEYLLRQGVPINATDNEGKTPLHGVCILLPEVWQDGRGIPPAYIKGIAILECLVKNGAKVNAQDAEGNTPFHRVKKECRTVEVMMELGADPFLTNAQGESPFTQALEIHRNAAAVMVACMNAAQKKQSEKELDRFIKTEQEKALIRRDDPDSVLTEKQLNEIVERYTTIKKIRNETPTVNSLSTEAYLSLWAKNYLKAENYEIAQKYAGLLGREDGVQEIDCSISEKSNPEDRTSTRKVVAESASKADGIRITEEELATVLKEYRKEVIPVMVEVGTTYLKMRDLESFNKLNSDAYPGISTIEDHLRNQVQKAKPKEKKSMSGWENTWKSSKQPLSASDLREKNALKTQLSSQIRKYRSIQGKLLTYLKRLKRDDVEKVYIQVAVEQERLMPQADQAVRRKGRRSHDAEGLKSFYTYYVEEDLADQILQFVEGKNYSPRVRLAADDYP